VRHVLLRFQRNARVGLQVDAKQGTESVITSWRRLQSYAMRLGRRKLTSGSLARRQIVNETGVAYIVEVVRNNVDQ